MAVVAYKGITLNLGLVAIVGDLHKPFEVSNEEKFNVICPSCDGITKLSQVYQCPDHGDFSLGDAARAKELADKTMVRVTPEDVKAAKESKLPKGKLDIKIHPLEEAQSRLINGELNYVFAAEEGFAPSFGLLFDSIVTHDDLLFMGMINLKNNDKLFRLMPGMNHQLLLQEVVWPSDVKELAQPEYEYTDKHQAMAEALIVGMVEEFDPTNYTREARQRVAELIAAAQSGEPTMLTSVKKGKGSALDNLESMLESALANAPKKKAPAKRTRKAS